MPTKAFLIAKPGDAQHHGVGPLAIAEERQCRRLSAQLVFGIVQIGKELDFRHRDKAIMRSTDGKAKNALFIQQRVDDPCGAKARLQLLRDPVNAAFATDVFAHQQCLGVGKHHVMQRPVDDLGQRLRRVHLANLVAQDVAPILRAWPVRRGTGALWRNDTGHHVMGRFQARSGHDILRNLSHLFQRLCVDG